MLTGFENATQRINRISLLWQDPYIIHTHWCTQSGHTHANCSCMYFPMAQRNRTFHCKSLQQFLTLLEENVPREAICTRLQGDKALHAT